MNTGKTRFTSGIGRTLLGALALVLLVVFVGPQAAQASTAANAKITNTVYVNYDDEFGNPMDEEDATADITIALLPAAPDLSDPVDQETFEGNDSVTLTYTITSNANGADIYELSAASVDIEIDLPTITTINGVAPGSNPIITLGGTTLAATTTATNAITVPYDNDEDSDSNSTNGITAGDTIVINDVEYIVAAGGISEDSGTNLTTITLTGNVAAGVAAGSIVGERDTFDVVLTTGDLTTDYDGYHTISTTATSQADNDEFTNQETDIDVTRAALNVVKEVSTDGTNFFASIANVAPTSTLTYRITVTNDGANDATNVEITDAEPQFTTYSAETAQLSTTVGASYDDGGNTDLDDDKDGAPDDGYDFDLSSAGEVTYSAGTIPPGNSVVLFFQVTID